MTKFEVTLKPTAMAKKHMKMCPEFVVTVSAFYKECAIVIARSRAEAEGFKGYAITRIKECK